MSTNGMPEVDWSAREDEPARPSAGGAVAPADEALERSRRPHLLAWPFWNLGERRLRALWRVAALVLVAAVLSQAINGSLRALGVARQGFDAPLRSVLTLLLVLASVALAARLFERRSLVDYGLRLDRAWWADCGFGLALGALLMSLIFAFEWSAGWVTAVAALDAGVAAGALAQDLGVLALLFVSVAVNEELLFRGYLLRTLAEGLRGSRLVPRAALGTSLALTSGVFGVAHLGNPDATWVSSLNITGAGVLLAASYVLTGRLGVSIGLHMTWNFFQGPVYGFAVSGTHVSRATVLTLQQGGPELWTGGAFGPEAGLVGVLAMALGLALVVLWTRWREGRLALCVALVEPPPARGRGAATA